MTDVIRPHDKHSPLLPERHPQGDLFICDLVDVVLKADMQGLEYPFYSLTKKPDRTPRRFEANDRWIEFRPSAKGLPTIYDKDLLIYAISHIVREKERTGHAPQRVEIHPYHFLRYTNRQTGGRDYQALCDSIERLDGTRYRTNVRTGGQISDKWFGLIEEVELVTDERSGRPQRMTLKLSDWTMSAIEANEVLTLHRDYWRLRRPIERRLYEIVRKHCGKQPEWRISMTKLHGKSGSQATRREFRRKVSEIVEDNHLPDYDVRLENDILIVEPRSMMRAALEGSVDLLLSGDGYQAAKKAAPGWDVYHLEQEWRDWVLGMMADGMGGPRDADAAFVGFCKKWFEKRGRPK